MSHSLRFPTIWKFLWLGNSSGAKRKWRHTILFQKRWNRQKCCGSWQHLMLKAKISRAVKSEEVYLNAFRTTIFGILNRHISIWLYERKAFMEALKQFGLFQNEVLGMNWLNRLIETILNACGLDTTGKNRSRYSVFHLWYHKGMWYWLAFDLNYLIIFKVISRRKE